MHPQPQAAPRQGLQRHGVIDFLGVGVIDGVTAQGGEIPPGLIAGLILLGLSQQALGVLQQGRREPLVPDAAAQRRQGMGLPLAQVHQQTAHRSWFGGALGLLQAATKLRIGQRLDLTAGEGQQLLQLLNLGGGEIGGLQGRALTQQVVPLLHPSMLERLSVTVVTELAEITKGTGMHPALAPAKQVLLWLVQPAPAGGPGCRTVAAGHQFGELRQADPLLGGRLHQQQPGGTEIAATGGSGSQDRWLQQPGGLIQTDWRLMHPRQGGHQIQLSQGDALGTGVPARPETDTAAVDGFDQSQFRPLRADQTDEITRLQTPCSTGAGKGLLSLRGSRRGAGPRSGPA